jgi:hypothetical protein
MITGKRVYYVYWLLGYYLVETGKGCSASAEINDLAYSH